MAIINIPYESFINVLLAFAKGAEEWASNCLVSLTISLLATLFYLGLRSIALNSAHE